MFNTPIIPSPVNAKERKISTYRLSRAWRRVGRERPWRRRILHRVVAGQNASSDAG